MTTLDPSVLMAGGLAVIAVAATVVVRSWRDPVTVLTLFLLCLVLFPAKLVVGPLGGSGQPALLVAFAAAGWWAAARAVRDDHLDIGPQPIRYTALAFGWMIAFGWVIARTGPISVLDRNESTRTVLLVAAMIGVSVLAADGIDRRDRLEAMIARIVAAGAFLAALGWIQFFTGVDVARWLQLPGLSYARDFSGVLARSIFNRPAGTALHPIEYGVVLGAVFPLAVHRLMYAPHGRRGVAGSAVLLIGPAVAMSVSRSGVLTLVVGLIVLGKAWGWRRRLNVTVAAVVATAVMWAVIPGLIGTLKGLFVNYESDLSVQGRIDDIPLVAERVWQHPVLGAGTGTFSHVTDFPLDNQFYDTAMENGLLGVAVMLLLLFSGFVLGRRVGRIAVDETDRHLGHALAGSVLALGVSAYTFSAFFYRIYLGLLFLLLGCTGALWRMSVRDVADASTPVPAAVRRGRSLATRSAEGSLVARTAT